MKSVILACSLTLLSALSIAGAWPIFFYEGDKCEHYPVATIVYPPPPNICVTFGSADVGSYFGGTRDGVENVILYNDLAICDRDEAHRAYANYTINNNHTACQAFPEIPRAYVFIEEILGPLLNTVPPTFDMLGCNALTVEN